MYGAPKTCRLFKVSVILHPSGKNFCGRPWTWRSLLDSFCARADTYVKTCLVTRGNKRLQKKSTRTVRASVDPLYQDTIKYSASNVHGRYIQVSLNRSTRTPSNTRPPTSTADTYRSVLTALRGHHQILGIQRPRQVHTGQY